MYTQIHVECDGKGGGGGDNVDDDDDDEVGGDGVDVGVSNCWRLIWVLFSILILHGELEDNRNEEMAHIHSHIAPLC